MKKAITCQPLAFPSKAEGWGLPLRVVVQIFLFEARAVTTCNPCSHLLVSCPADTNYFSSFSRRDWSYTQACWGCFCTLPLHYKRMSISLVKGGQKKIEKKAGHLVNRFGKLERKRRRKAERKSKEKRKFFWHLSYQKKKAKERNWKGDRKVIFGSVSCFFIYVCFVLMQ